MKNYENRRISRQNKITMPSIMGTTQAFTWDQNVKLEPQNTQDKEALAKSRHKH